MEPEQILNSLRRAIKRRVDALSISVTSGGVDSMETYKYIIGQINALESVQQEISNLLNDKEQNETGTVININGSKPQDHNTK
jgi:asparagine synthetase B (glutamine-hydrolysing)